VTLASRCCKWAFGRLAAAASQKKKKIYIISQSLVVTSDELGFHHLSKKEKKGQKDVPRLGKPEGACPDSKVLRSSDCCHGSLDLSPSQLATRQSLRAPPMVRNSVFCLLYCVCFAVQSVSFKG